MIKFQFILIFFFLIGNSVFSQEDTIDYFKFSGNKRTKSVYLSRFVQAHQGDIADSATIAEDLRRLRTLSSILKVTPFVIPTDSGTVLNYQVRERWTILPVGDFGVTDGSFWIGGGAMESNLLGRGIYTYCYFEYGSPYAFHVILRNPYLYGSKWGIEAISKYSTRTENWKYAASEYFSDLEFSLAAKYEYAFEKDIYAGIKYQEEKLMNKPESDFLALDSRCSVSGFVKVIVQKIDNQSFYLNGWKNNFLAEQFFPVDATNPTFLLRDDFHLYKRLLKSNLALRVSIGFSNEQETGYMPLITDSYNYIRGSGYREYKGNRSANLNLEYRYTLYENKYAGIQLLSFADIGTTQAKTRNQVTAEENLVYIGPGLRLIFIRAYNAVLCIDYGINVQNPVRSSFVFGWGQYF